MAVGTLQKARKEVAPFEDDFNDGNYTGWSVFGGTWSASSYYARNTSGGTDRLVKAFTEPDYAMSFSYYREDSSNEILLYFRAAGGSGGTLRLDLTGTYARIVDSASSPTQLAYSSAHGSATGTWYDGYVEVDGANVKVMLGEQGEMLEQVFNVATATTTDTARLEIRSQNGAARFDNIRILGDGLTQTTTFAVNNANEMTSMTDVNGTTAFAYDGWGRMESKSRGSHAADYGFRYGHFLADYDTNFPDEGDVEYVTGGDGKRRVRTAGMDEVLYRWGASNNILSEEDGAGAFLKGIVDGNIASYESGGTDYLYTLGDHLLSSRLLFDQSKAGIAQFDYSPYGDALLSSNANATERRYTSHIYDASIDSYLSLFRAYTPSWHRWSSRDPLGMIDGPNVYLYVSGNPAVFIDLLGTRTGRPGPPPGHPRPTPPREPFNFTGSYPYQHCVNSCVLARAIGRPISKIVMDGGKEGLDVIVGGGLGHQGYANSACQPSDWRDNKTGRDCAKKENRHMSCEECCQASGIRPDTPDGPNTPRPYGPFQDMGWWGNPNPPPYVPSHVGH